MTDPITAALAAFHVMRPSDQDRQDMAAALAAADRAAWQPIDDAEPDVEYLLGWWEKWPTRVWRQEVGLAHKGNTCGPMFSNAWWHGRATHFRPLPPAPAEGL